MMLHWRASLCGMFLGIASIIAGCSGGPDLPEAYPVTGKVTGGSGSLQGVIIAFNPVDDTGVPASGTIAADGSYSLQTADGRAGAVPGKYKVTLAGGGGQAAMTQMMSQARNQAAPMPGRPTGPPKAELPFPEKYRSFETSDKEVEVSAESNTIDISL